MGDLKEYIDQTSFRGVSIEVSKHLAPALDIGLELGWNVFYKKEPAKAYSQGTSSISGIQYRYTNIAPMIMGAKVYAVSGRIAPYGGLGCGVMYVNRSTDFGMYRITKEGWPFCIRPEAGLITRLAHGVCGSIGAKYYAGFKTEELEAQSFIGLNIGLVFFY